MGKNIIICCDGTNNQFGKVNTNVVRLFQCLDRSPDKGQVVYYNPGVGTIADQGLKTRTARAISVVAGLLFGYGIVKDVQQATRFLSHHYQVGDKIYMFGFSRGAFTARIIAGLIHRVGLPEAGADNLMPYLTRIYRFYRDKKLVKAYKETFGRACEIHFLGLWDTVSSIGWIWNPTHFPHTRNNDSVISVRHAVALDEKRCFYSTNLWGDHQDKVEAWFPGVHSDVGGGYPENDSSLWKVPFKWMCDEAKSCGLHLDEFKVSEILGETDDNTWSLDPQHNSMKWYFKIAEFLPKRYWDFRSQPPRFRYQLPLFKGRYVPDGALLHRSVVHRIRHNSEYRPNNLEAGMSNIQSVTGNDVKYGKYTP